MSKCYSKCYIFERDRIIKERCIVRAASRELALQAAESPDGVVVWKTVKNHLMEESKLEVENNEESTNQNAVSLRYSGKDDRTADDREAT